MISKTASTRNSLSITSKAPMVNRQLPLSQIPLELLHWIPSLEGVVAHPHSALMFCFSLFGLRCEAH